MSDPGEVSHDSGAKELGAPKTRVFVLDDHEVVRRGLRLLIDAQPDMEVVGEASTAGEAILRVPPTRPQVAILDIMLPDGDGIEVCRELVDAYPELACLMLTSVGGDEAMLSSIIAGAKGFVIKQVDGGFLIDSIRKVASGESLISPTMAQRALAKARTENTRASKLDLLTAREKRILDLIAEGKTNRQIGAELFLAEKTVKNCVSDVLAKLGVSRRTEAAVYAIRSGAAPGAHPDQRPTGPGADR